MSRNGSGTMSVPNTLVAGTTITASALNQNYSDIASEITNSLALDGQSTMTGQIKAAAGTVTAPGYTFGSDTDTGPYRSAAGEYSVAADGVQITKTNSTGLDVVTGRVKQGGASLLPPGVIVPYAGSSIPTGWLSCDGSAVSRTTYADLYTAIGTTYGTGDGSTTFTLPDYGGRVPAGKEAVATRLTTAGSGVDGATLGATGGAQTVTLAAAQIPQISGTATATSTFTGGVSQLAITAGGGTISQGGGGSQNLVGITGTVATTISSLVAGASSPTAVNKVQPTIICNFIIKT